MTDFIQAWQCIGCGRIEAPQPCIGVCQDRKVRFVYAGEYEEALEHARRADRKADMLQKLVRQLALTNPRSGQWEQCYRAMQGQARRLLATLEIGEVSPAIRRELAAHLPETAPILVGHDIDERSAMRLAPG